MIEMINVFEGRNGNELYPKILKQVYLKGKTVSPRGLRTKELYPAVTLIRNPKERFLTVLGRGGNPFFLCAEALWILAARGDIDFITYYNSKMANYADKGYSGFHGAYGQRMRSYGVYKNGTVLSCGRQPVDQLVEVYKKLVKDKDTRQAVMTFWNPFFDNGIRTKDIPCNNLSMFKIRNGKLHLHQIIRSNDLNKGLFPTNAFQFSIIQEVLAGWLNIPVGELLFFSDSLHIYDADKTTENVLRHRNKRFDIYRYVEPLDARLPKAKFDFVLAKIMKDEAEMRLGNFSSIGLTMYPFWNSFWKTLRAWCLRKHGLERDALNIVLTIEAPDIRAAVLEYMYRNTKNSLLYTPVQRLSIPEPVKDYIFGRI